MRVIGDCSCLKTFFSQKTTIARRNYAADAWTGREGHQSTVLISSKQSSVACIQRDLALFSPQMPEVSSNVCPLVALS
jgi:hypothetical protein